MEYITSDTHLGHAACLNPNHLARPFQDVNEMNAVIINNINAVVKRKDTLYHLGDFSHRCSLETIIHFRESIKCENIVLVVGNHDARYQNKDRFKALFSKLTQIEFYSGHGVEIVMCHYAMLSYPKSHYGAYHLFGHSHGKLQHPNNHCFDVGVDSWGFKPLSIEEVKEEFKRKALS